jgi:outer membrane PBP1 activator LpoA protein
VSLLRASLDRTRHAVLRRRQARARRRGEHERATALLRLELYTDFARPMAAIHLDMAWERLAAAKIDEAAALLKLADDERLGEAARLDKRLAQCWLLIEQGKAAEAEARLRAMEGDPMSRTQARRRRELLVEAALARKALEAARDLAGDAPELAAWRLVAEAEMDLRQGAREAADPRLLRARALLAARPDAPWLRRRVDRLLRERK